MNDNDDCLFVHDHNAKKQSMGYNSIIYLPQPHRSLLVPRMDLAMVEMKEIQMETEIHYLKPLVGQTLTRNFRRRQRELSYPLHVLFFHYYN